MGFTIVSKEDGMHISQDLDNKSRQEMYLKLEADIKSQIKMCEANQKHFKVTGDVASANKFQQMSEHTKKDLDALRFAYKRGDPVPKFHYEVRAFSIIVCNADLTDHEMELTLERGINYNVTNPKEVHTYCRYSERRQIINYLKYLLLSKLNYRNTHSKLHSALPIFLQD